MTTEVLTFGCRLNISESETIRQHAEQAGLSDALVINTCAVTDEATRQARQAIRRASREQPERAIIVTGCAAQIEPARFAAMPEVARVMGNAEKLRAESWATLARSNSLHIDRQDGAPAQLAVSDIMQARGLEIAPVDHFAGRTRGFVQVQNGCDHRCTFCVIPFGRGRSRSAAPEAVIAQVRQLVENGTAEVVLTGVDLTSYGPDLATPVTLGQLVRRILREVPELPRLRLSSIDAVEVDDTLMALIADEPRLMPHLHLSLQSGDDMILKRMKRRHSRDQAVRFCEAIRAARPDIVLGADLIAGFPTEDEAMFSRSMELIADCGLAQVHVFPYSPRPETPAARMPQLPLALVKERAARLREAAARAWRTHLQQASGQTHNVLTERGNTGRTEGFTPVAFGSEVVPGQIMRVTMSGHDGKRLLAA
ncbi:MAG: tRNA (N(6)-L-threonylcarbamoyladenosine(37)-C(2))-methylthiotransferase MtaB [Bosea sp. (in: a-proteobacteria)]